MDRHFLLQRASAVVGPGMLAAFLGLALVPDLWAVEPLALAPCHLDGLAESLRCGVLEVAEDPASPGGSLGGRRLPLQIAVLPALSRRAAPDPVFVLAGGPGQGARAMAGLANAMLRGARQRRDVVLVDLRGTGDSKPFHCPSLAEPLVQTIEGHPLGVDVEGCLRELDRDPRRYTHESAMADLDTVRAALGYPRINLWGGSFGTRAALAYARLYPERVRSVILDGAAPFALRFPLSVPADNQRALDRLLADCAAEAACHRAYPWLAADLAALLARLERAPVRPRLAHPRTGEPLEVVLDRHALAMGIRVALYSAEHASLLPHAIDRASHGDFAPFAALAERAVAWGADSMALGVTLSVVCSEDVVRLEEGEIAAAAAGTFLGRTEIDEWRAVCARWPVGPLPARVAEIRPLEIPALILSGDLDPVTPPRSGAAMARHFPRSLQVTVPGAAHNVSHLGCVPDLMAAFLERGSAEGLDASCVSAHRRPPFAIGLAGPSP